MFVRACDWSHNSFLPARVQVSRFIYTVSVAYGATSRCLCINIGTYSYVGCASLLLSDLVGCAVFCSATREQDAAHVAVSRCISMCCSSGSHTRWCLCLTSFGWLDCQVLRTVAQCTCFCRGVGP